jgi:hypothetical protein
MLLPTQKNASALFFICHYVAIYKHQAKKNAFFMDNSWFSEWHHNLEDHGLDSPGMMTELVPHGRRKNQQTYGRTTQ